MKCLTIIAHASARGIEIDSLRVEKPPVERVVSEWQRAS